ncbi:MAG: MBL fold metallo-hydrolase [Okeania sp. SIO3B5]|uniref:MBL fold metallo-hydrolase n=1 Tax=Okeania sp. SIO3B5 TaxID=2607811 RepID=UPI001400830C|nr:MBL fold metallo-hydrolase [Okeania sp. SIO3B5]NEO55038.1 MBL fold metallo-hydrolase [Okeania sp. SIO3B5]
MLQCLAYSVGHADDGICLLVQIGPHRVLLDCGITDISLLTNNNENKQLLPADIVLCSHAHSDHAQGLFALHQAFPQLPIYASEATTKLLPINWSKFAVSEIPDFCQPLPWHSPIELCSGLTVELFPAGHLPGATVFLLTYTAENNRTYKLLYTGDLFLSNSRLVEGLPLEDLRGLKPDVLIVEGSYGTARYPHRRQLENHLAERIYQAITSGISVILPTPALGLAQELLMLLRSHHYFTGRDLDIWVEEQVAQVCDLYLQLLSQFPPAVKNFAQHQPLFWDEKVRPRVLRQLPGKFPSGEKPYILIADRDTDLSQYIVNQDNSFVVLMPETPGKISQELNFVHTETYLLTEHCDGLGTTQLIHNLRPQHIVFVHGCPSYLADLTNLEELRNRYQLHSPGNGTLVELPIGDTFIVPTLPEINYEGELTELDTEVIISLPQRITNDTRWQFFADTGIVEVRWQGEELVMKGISQRQLLSQTGDRFISPELDCCGNCLYYRGQHCSNPTSALYGFRVTSDGYCPMFKSLHFPSTEEIE